VSGAWGLGVGVVPLFELAQGAGEFGPQLWFSCWVGVHPGPRLVVVVCGLDYGHEASRPCKPSHQLHQLHHLPPLAAPARVASCSCAPLAWFVSCLTTPLFCPL